MADNGPYETERAASAAARSAVPPSPDRSILTQPQRFEVMLAALSDAGVEVSEFEQRSLWWLANYEDYLTGLIAGWVTRAHEAGKAA